MAFLNSFSTDSNHYALYFKNIFQRKILESARAYAGRVMYLQEVELYKWGSHEKTRKFS